MVSLLFSKDEYKRNVKFADHVVSSFEAFVTTPLFDRLFFEEEGRLFSLKEAPDIKGKDKLIRFVHSLMEHEAVYQTLTARSKYHVRLLVAMKRFLRDNDAARVLLYDLIALVFSEFIPMELVKEQYEYVGTLGLTTRLNVFTIILSALNYRFQCRDSTKKIPFPVLKQFVPLKENTPCVVSENCRLLHWQHTPCVGFNHSDMCEFEPCQHSHDCLACRLFQVEPTTEAHTIPNCREMPSNELLFEAEVLARLVPKTKRFEKENEQLHALGFTDEQLNTMRAHCGVSLLGQPIRLDRFFPLASDFYANVALTQPETDVWGRVRRERLFQLEVLGPHYVFAHPNLIRRLDNTVVCPRLLSLNALFDSAHSEITASGNHQYLTDPMHYFETVLYPYITHTREFQEYFHKVYRGFYPPRYAGEITPLPPLFLFNREAIAQFRYLQKAFTKPNMTPRDYLCEAFLEMASLPQSLYTACFNKSYLTYDGVFIKHFQFVRGEFVCEVNDQAGQLLYKLSKARYEPIHPIRVIYVRPPPSPPPSPPPVFVPTPIARPKPEKPKGVQVTGPSLCGKGNNPLVDGVKKKTIKKKSKASRASSKKK